MENRINERSVYEEYTLVLDDLLGNSFKIYSTKEEIEQYKKYLVYLNEEFIEYENKFTHEEYNHISLKLKIANVCLTNIEKNSTHIGNILKLDKLNAKNS